MLLFCALGHIGRSHSSANRIREPRDSVRNWSSWWHRRRYVGKHAEYCTFYDRPRRRERSVWSARVEVVDLDVAYLCLYHSTCEDVYSLFRQMLSSVSANFLLVHWQWCSECHWFYWSCNLYTATLFRIVTVVGYLIAAWQYWMLCKFLFTSRAQKCLTDYSIQRVTCPVT